MLKKITRSHVRDHIPLEQGLRLEWQGDSLMLAREVRDHIPLEQGLRQYNWKIEVLGLSVSETIFH